MQRRQAFLVALCCAVALLAPASALAGTLSASPSPLDFGAQQIDNGTQTRFVGINNDNTTATTLGAATITGPDAAAFQISNNNCDGSNLGPGPNSGCGINVSWTPAMPAGAKSAQLEIPNNGTLSPLIVPLTATALAGPRSVITPSTIEFGNIAIGASRSQLVSVSNSGDADLVVQQAFIVGGTPSFFPISANTCTGRPIVPGGGCSFVVGFAPATAGLKEGSVFLITNENGPVTTLAVSGTAYPAPAGAATVTGAAQVGSGLGCQPVGFSPEVSFAYQWLRNGAAIAGATAAGYAPVDADVGTRLSCRVGASNPVGSATVTSSQTAPVAPRSLSGLSGAFVGQDSCRIARVARSLRIGSRTVKIRSGSPLTPAEPLTVSSRGSSLELSVDGRTLARGRTVATLAPRTLAPYGASSTLSIKVDGVSGSTSLALAPCLLAVRLTGASDRPSWLAISARTAASKAIIQLPSSLRLRTRGYLGRATIGSFGQPAQTFQLHGSATTYNDVTVRISKSRVKVSGLPEQTGVVSLNFTAGALTGRPGPVTAAASLLSAGGQTASALADFTP